MTKLDGLGAIFWESDLTNVYQSQMRLMIGYKKSWLCKARDSQYMREISGRVYKMSNYNNNAECVNKDKNCQEDQKTTDYRSKEIILNRIFLLDG